MDTVYKFSMKDDPKQIFELRMNAALEMTVSKLNEAGEVSVVMRITDEGTKYYYPDQLPIQAKG